MKQRVKQSAVQRATPRAGVKKLPGIAVDRTDECNWRQRALEYAGVFIWNGFPDGVWCWSENSGQLFGLPPEKHPGSYQAFLDRVHPEDRDFVEKSLASAARQNADFGFEHRIVRPDGAVHWVSGKGTVVQNAHDGSARILGALQDITARKEAEEALARGYAWMQVIQEASVLANSRLEYAGTFGPVATALRRLAPVDHFMILLEEGEDTVFAVVETKEGESPRLKPNTRVPFHGSFLEHLKEVGRPYIIFDLAAGGRHFPEDLLVMEDGLRSCVRIPLYNAGEFLGALALASRQVYAFNDAHLPHLEPLAIQVAHTVANIKRYQQARGEAEHLATIVREVHHRIKNNLQGVVGLLGHYREEHPSLAHVLNNAIGQLHTVAEVHNLLSHHTNETVLLHELVQGVCRTVAPLCSHRIESMLDFSVCESLVSASEAVPLALVLNELIQNAINHGYPDGEKGVIKVILDEKPDKILLKVLDDGVAPPDRVNGENGEGFGTGLNLVRALLPAKGVSFRLYRGGEWTVAEVGLMPDMIPNWTCRFPACHLHNEV
ncbi:MAG: PAS domain-containing protein [Gammaproteobacteria bacterium]|nr:PAS domain-containing protein [Gammaproteobacteria bacterium]